jgi:hypothetical protein
MLSGGGSKIKKRRVLVLTLLDVAPPFRAAQARLRSSYLLLHSLPGTVKLLF